MRKMFWAALAVMAVAACSADGKAEGLLSEQGYTDIEMYGWTPFACSDSDTFSSGFAATNTNGHRVEGVVCCGWLKSCTVRF